MADPKKETEKMNFWLDSIALNSRGGPVAVVGTNCGALSNGDIKKVDAAVKKLFKQRSSIHILNTYGRKFFFPVENSLNEDNSQYLEPLKKTLAETALGVSKQFPQFQERNEVFLSWMFFIEAIQREFKTHVPLKTVLEKGWKAGLSTYQVDKVLSFFNEMGAVVYFGKQSLESENGYLVLSPQWLVEALACYLYDPIHHGGKEFDHPDFAEDISRYEEDAIISKSLLKEFWTSKGYGTKEQDFILDLSLKTLLMSKYIFSDASKEEDLSLDAEAFLVPGMLNKICEDLDERLPSQDQRISFIVKAHMALPKGFFERIICAIINESAQIEGSVSPKLYSMYAEVSFRDIAVFIQVDRAATSILFHVERFQRKVLPKIIEMTKRIVTQVVLEAYGDSFPFDVLFVSSLDPKYKCKDEDHAIAVTKSLAQVKLYQQARSLDMDHFADFVQTQEEKKEEEVKVAKANGKYDCFLAHEWGTQQNGFKSHQTVLEVGKKLSQNGFKVWVDEEQLPDKRNIAKGIVQGLAQSDKIVVFFTKRYLDRTNDENNNCSKELNSAVKKGLQNIIVVILDAALLNPKAWFGTVADYELGHKLYIDFSTEEAMEKNFDQLCEAIGN